MMDNQAITDLLTEIKSGRKDLVDEVFGLLYAEIKSIAGHQLKQLSPGQTITPTVLAQLVLSSAREHLGEQHPLSIGSYFTLAKIYQKQDRLADAIDLISGIMDQSKNRLTDDNERIIAYNTLGDLYMAQEVLKNALIYKEKSWQVAKNLLGDDVIRTLSQRLRYAEVLQKNHHFGAADKYLKTVQDRLQEQGVDYPDLQQMIERLNKA